MRISRTILLASALVSMLTVSVGGAGGQGAPDRSPEFAYHASVAAMKAHDFADAIPDLKFAADHGVFLAQYYLSRLLAVDSQPFTNRGEAFARLKTLVADNRGIDPYMNKRAPFVADAERLLADFYRRGVPTASVPADAAMARAHLEHAALRLGDTEAQYQLALTDIATPDLAARGLDTLDMLAETKHHAAAAAQIALIYDQGRLRERSPAAALAYALLAVNLASQEDRIWIGDIHQSLFCQASGADRAKAADFAAQLQRNDLDVTDGDYQASEIGHDRTRVQGVLDLGNIGTQRVCGNGEPVPEPAGWQPLARPLANSDALVQTAQSARPKGFNSLVGFIAPPLGVGLKDLETPSAGDEHGEPLGSRSAPSSQ